MGYSIVGVTLFADGTGDINFRFFWAGGAPAVGVTAVAAGTQASLDFRVRGTRLLVTAEPGVIIGPSRARATVTLYQQ